MKIERVRSQIVRLPADEPLADNKTIPGATRDLVRREGYDQGRHRRARRDVLRRGADGCAEGGRRWAGRADHRRRPARDRAHRRQAAHGRRHVRAQRHLHAGPVGHRHGAMGYPRQGPGAAGGQAARRLSRPRPRLRQRRPDAHAVARRGGDGGRPPRRTRLAGHEDPARPAGRHLAGGGGGAHPPRPRGHRPRHPPDVRHQPALDRARGDRHRRAARALSPALAGGRDGARRLCRACQGRGQADDADRRRRIRLRHRPLPAHAGGALGRHRHDRPGARRRHHPVDEGGRHGRGVQPARWCRT